MLFSRSAHKAFLSGLLALGIPAGLLAQGIYTPSGSEYPIAPSLPGDQVHPCLALTTNGGFLVWEDNITDGYGLGISAIRLDSGFSPTLAPFRVNVTGTNDQEHAKVSLLKGGGAAFVWQGGKEGLQHIFARFLSSSNTWLSSTDIVVNAVSTRYQVNPAIATLTNGNVVIVYSSLNQQATNSLQDVYGQIFSSTGQKVGGEFLINQFAAYNQRDPSVAALATGGFAVVWISEQERSGNMDNANSSYLYSVSTNRATVDVFGRLYSAAGTPVAGEFLVNSSYDICSSPVLAAGTDGGFMVAWAQRNAQIPQYSWDVYARPYSSAGVGGSTQTVNTYLYGDQYLPRISALGTDYFVVWTSLAQDGSREGVFGQYLRSDGTRVGGELRINTTTIGQQIHPNVASDGFSRFVIAWTSYTAGGNSFDLFAQRYVNTAQPLVPMNPPFVDVPFILVNGAYVPQIRVSWPLQSGLPIDHYEVYANGSLTPAALLTNVGTWTLTGIAPGSSNSFQVTYATTDGRRAPLSGASTATTWLGYSWYGELPLEWMQKYYTWDSSHWPSPNVPLTAGGPSLEQVFLSGGSPLDASTWLRTALAGTPQGFFLNWNPHPGYTYQVQTSSNLSSWSNIGAPRFAAGSNDSLYVGIHNPAYYRVLLLR
ncbi:MAG TPA: hypothetical protein VG167_04760 [Verrucomicrobiae bacterium]|nr:hypothetical protein [Verrucomicrobiae bacterium]